MIEESRQSDASDKPSEDDKEYVYDIRGRHKRKTAILLAIFLGWIGVHRFYLGKYFSGVFCVLFCWTLDPFFISIIDVLKYWSLREEGFMHRYNRYAELIPTDIEPSDLRSPHFQGPREH